MAGHIVSRAWKWKELNSGDQGYSIIFILILDHRIVATSFKEGSPIPSAILLRAALTNTPESVLYQHPIQVGTLVITPFLSLNKQGGHDVSIREV